MRSMASETFLAFLDHLFRRANALLKQKKKKRAGVTESRLMFRCFFFIFFFYLSGPKFRLVSQLRQSQ